MPLRQDGDLPHTNTHIYSCGWRRANNKQADKPTSVQTHPSLPFTTVLSFGILPHPLCIHTHAHTRARTHTQTQPLRWGNWMWQQSLGGLFGGYRVNLWNRTQLTPAGWFWHPQQTSLSHYSNHWGLNTAASCTSAPAPCEATPEWRKTAQQLFETVLWFSKCQRAAVNPVVFRFQSHCGSCAHTHTHLLPHSLTYSFTHTAHYCI